MSIFFRICKTVGVTYEKLQIQNMYECFFDGLKDYTMDSRGDVGAWYLTQYFMLHSFYLLEIRRHEQYVFVTKLCATGQDSDVRLSNKHLTLSLKAWSYFNVRVLNAAHHNSNSDLDLSFSLSLKCGNTTIKAVLVSTFN